MKKVIIVFLIIFAACYYMLSQEADTVKHTYDRSQGLKVYLDCPSCDMDYFKTYLTAINYVNRRMEADVYVQVTDLPTASGGAEYTAVFQGEEGYSKYDDTLLFSVPSYASADESRQIILDYIQLGLVPFLLRTPAKENMFLFVDYDAGIDYEDSTNLWKYWLFTVSGGGSIFKEKSTQKFNILSNLYISKVTPKIKFEFNSGFEFSEREYKLYEDDSLVYYNLSSQRMLGASILFVKSIGGHFGLGGVGGYGRSEYSNLKNNIAIGPAIEYSIFEYEDVSTHQFRFIYTLGFEYSEYFEPTIYDNLYEQQYIHSLRSLFSYKVKQWDIYAAASARTQLDDWSRYLISFDANLTYEFKKPKGLRVFTSGSFSYVRDQVGLRGDGLSSDDLLLGNYETETDYHYHFSFGISFSFGSIDNNTVNPRFDF